MLHTTLNPQLFPSWDCFYKHYTIVSVEGSSRKCLLRINRLNDTKALLLALARAYQTAQRQYKQWRQRVWFPLFDELRAFANKEKEVKFHVRPTHEYKPYKNQTWWEYSLSYEKEYGWSYSFSWIEEPAKKLHHDLGQKFYELDNYQKKFSSREATLEKLLSKTLFDFVDEKYPRNWLRENPFSAKVVKIELLGDEYWFCVKMNRHGQPYWENFIWQNNQTDTFKITKK